MQENQTPVRTPLASQWLAEPTSPLDRANRMLLSTIDGRRNAVELESIARALGLRPDALERLRGLGLIEFAPSPSMQPLPMALAAVKRHATELASLMLAGTHADLLTAAREIGTRAALLSWCERCAEAIAEHSGRERANLFWAKVCATLRQREPQAVDLEVA